MAETIIVCLIVVVALLLTARSIHRSLTGKAPPCPYSHGGVCPLGDAERKEKCEARDRDGTCPAQGEQEADR